MKKEGRPYQFESLSALHKVLGLPKPLHPLISLIETNGEQSGASARLPGPHVYNFYKISYKKNLSGWIKYGRGHYDFDDGGMVFRAPNQVSAEGENNGDHSGFTLAFHADFLLGHPLSTRIRQYGFFSYAVNEALHLSEQERATVVSVFRLIDEELRNRIDAFSQAVVISHIEALLNYSDRFYQRQFVTRKAVNDDVLRRMEAILDDCFHADTIQHNGLPTVQHLADQLNVSPGYLSDMLRSLTGQSAQQHIHDRLIKKAKEKISSTNMTIGEIAYSLGFEHQSSFNKFFRSKTNTSPRQYRESFG